MFADHYQFFIYDSECDPYEIDDEWSEEIIRKGYLQGVNSIHVVSTGDFNDHAVAVYLGRPVEVLSYDKNEDENEDLHDAITRFQMLPARFRHRQVKVSFRSVRSDVGRKTSIS